MLAGRTAVPVGMPAPTEDPPGDGGGVGVGACVLVPAVVDPPPGEGGRLCATLPVPMVDMSPDMVDGSKVACLVPQARGTCYLGRGLDTDAVGVPGVGW